MIKIALQNKNYPGKFTIIDDADLPLVEQYRWHFLSNNWGGYATTYTPGGIIYLHRLLLKAPKGVLVDHINRNKLDNRRNNIRLCSTTGNNVNRATYARSGYKGVHYDYRPKDKKGYWRAHLTLRINGKIKHFSRYCKSKKEAALAYNEMARNYHGEYAVLNEV